MIDETLLIKELYKLADVEIEKCEQMYEEKNFDMLMQHKYGECCFYKAIQKTKDIQKVNEWIPCSERLPEIDGEYLCWCKGSIYTCACVRKFAKDLYLIDKFEFKKESGAGFYYYESDWGYFKEEDVVAWMPLPEPYKE